MKGRTGLLKGGWRGDGEGRVRKPISMILHAPLRAAAVSVPISFFFFWFKIWISILAAPLFFANRGDPSLSHRLNAGLSCLLLTMYEGGKRHVGTVYVDACAREE